MTDLKVYKVELKTPESKYWVNMASVRYTNKPILILPDAYSGEAQQHIIDAVEVSRKNTVPKIHTLSTGTKLRATLVK